MMVLGPKHVGAFLCFNILMCKFYISAVVGIVTEQVSCPYESSGADLNGLFL